MATQCRTCGCSIPDIGGRLHNCDPLRPYVFTPTDTFPQDIRIVPPKYERLWQEYSNAFPVEVYVHQLETMRLPGVPIKDISLSRLAAKYADEMLEEHKKRFKS